MFKLQITLGSHSPSQKLSDSLLPDPHHVSLLSTLNARICSGDEKFIQSMNSLQQSTAF